jgi:hypothetical protein
MHGAEGRNAVEASVNECRGVDRQRMAKLGARGAVRTGGGIREGERGKEEE